MSGARSWYRSVLLPQRTDLRGSLGFGEVGKHVPFEVQRLFYLYGMPENATRGGHAHRAQHQFLLMLSGQCTVTVDDGLRREPVVLCSPSTALYAPPMLWLDLEGFTAGSICIVLTSGHYDEADYVRDRSEFLRLTGAAAHV